MEFHGTKTRFFVASDIDDFVNYLQNNYINIDKELNKRVLGTTYGCSKITGKNDIKLKRYNYRTSNK